MAPYYDPTYNSQQLPAPYRYQKHYQRSENQPLPPPPVPSILFTNACAIPIWYQSSIFTYYLCPTCIRPTETRYCSGRTEVRHEICSKHAEAATNPNFDLSDLACFRSAQLSGTLLNSACFRDATIDPEVEAQQKEEEAERKKRQEQQRRYLRRHLPPPSTTVAPDLAPPRPKLPVLPPDYPSTRITYRHDPLRNCTYSPTPDQRTLSSATVQARDAKKRRTMKAMRTEAERMSRPPDHPTPDWAALGKEKPADDDKCVMYKTDTIFCIAEHKRLLNEVKAKFEMKSVYWKRCNGEFVNGIREVVPEGEGEQKVQGAAGEGVASSEVQKWVLPGIKTTTPRPVLGTERAEDKAEGEEDKTDEGEQEDDDASSSGSSTISALSSCTITPAQLHAGESKDRDDPKDNRPTTNQPPAAEGNERAFTGRKIPRFPKGEELKVDYDAQGWSSSDQGCDVDINEKAIAQPKVVEVVKPSSTKIDEGVEKAGAKKVEVAVVAGPKMPHQTFLAREKLWKKGGCTEDNFIMTCWAFNRSASS